jgi:hypothetical protein
MRDRRTLTQLRRLSVTELSIAVAMHELIEEPRGRPAAARHSLAIRQPAKPTKEFKS